MTEDKDTDYDYELWVKQMKEWVKAMRPRPWQMAYHPTTYWTCDLWEGDE